jgi:hypothetical protein
MSQVPIWFERKFEFSFPVELHPNLSARLGSTAARLEETLRGRSHARPLEQILADCRAARERLLKPVDELNPSLFPRAIPHPRLKTPMRFVDHLYFVVEHDHHHLARIWEPISVDL